MKPACRIMMKPSSCPQAGASMTYSVEVAGAPTEAGGRAPARIDRWSAWPSVITTLAMTGFLLLCRLPGSLSFALLLSSFVVLPTIAISIFGFSVVPYIKRKRRAAASLVIALLIPAFLHEPISRASEYLHLGLTVWFGLGQIGSTLKPGTNPFSVHDWSVGFAGGPNTFLIYDRADQIALPLERHRRPRSSEDGIEENCAGKAEHLLGHYYVCNF